MRRPPRDPKEPLLGGYALFRVTYVGLIMGGGTHFLGIGVLHYDALPEAVFRTIILQTLVLCECA